MRPDFAAVRAPFPSSGTPPISVNESITTVGLLHDRLLTLQEVTPNGRRQLETFDGPLRMGNNRLASAIQMSAGVRALAVAIATMGGPRGAWRRAR